MLVVSTCGLLKNCLSCESFFQDDVTSTSLMAAAQEGHLSVVELLLSVGALVNSVNNVSHNYYRSKIIGGATRV